MVQKFGANPGGDLDEQDGSQRSQEEPTGITERNDCEVTACNNRSRASDALLRRDRRSGGPNADGR